jgi:hypothetical protein
MRLIHTSLATGLDMPGREAPPGGWRRVRVPTGAHPVDGNVDHQILRAGKLRHGGNVSSAPVGSL